MDWDEESVDASDEELDDAQSDAQSDAPSDLRQRERQAVKVRFYGDAVYFADHFCTTVSNLAQRKYAQLSGMFATTVPRLSTESAAAILSAVVERCRSAVLEQPDTAAAKSKLSDIEKMKAAKLVGEHTKIFSRDGMSTSVQVDLGLEAAPETYEQTILKELENHKACETVLRALLDHRHIADEDLATAKPLPTAESLSFENHLRVIEFLHWIDAPELMSFWLKSFEERLDNEEIISANGVSTLISRISLQGGHARDVMELLLMHAGAQILLHNPSQIRLSDDKVLEAHNHMVFVKGKQPEIEAASTDISADPFATIASNSFLLQHGLSGVLFRIIVAKNSRTDTWTAQRAKLVAIFEKHRVEIIPQPVHTNMSQLRSTDVIGLKRFQPYTIGQIIILPLKFCGAVDKKSEAGRQCQATKTAQPGKKTHFDVYVYLELKPGKCRVDLEMITQAIHKDYNHWPLLAKAMSDLVRTVKNFRMGSTQDKCVIRFPLKLKLPETNGHLLGPLELYPAPMDKVRWVENRSKSSEDLFYSTDIGPKSLLQDFGLELGRLRYEIQHHLKTFTVPKKYKIEFESSHALLSKIEALTSSDDDSQKLVEFVVILKMLEKAVKEKKKLIMNKDVLQKLHEMVLGILTESQRYSLVKHAASALVKSAEKHFNQEWPAHVAAHVAESHDSEILLEVFSIIEGMLKLSMWNHFGKVRNLGRECQHALVSVSMH